MNLHSRKAIIPKKKDLFTINFHRFIEKESSCNSLEIAKEFGISLKEVKILKQKMNRT